MKGMFLLADQPLHSLGYYLYDLESKREQFLYLLKARDMFLNVSESGFFEQVWFIVFNTEQTLLKCRHFIWVFAVY